MKKLIIICTLFFIAPFCNAENNRIYVDSINQQILEELQVISKLQKESHDLKKHAVEERQRRDSLQNTKIEGDLTTEYGVMAIIEDNTRQRPWTDGWNFYGVAAFIIALLSAFISWWTYREQKETQRNTKKPSQDAQRALLNDLLRHLYRNFVITYTMRTKMKDIDYKGYPSEEHFSKLKIPMENIHLDAFYGEDAKFQKMHELFLHLRNYNEEIDVALKHIIDPFVKRETKDEDFDLLEFKVFYLTEKIIDTIRKIWGEKPEFITDMKNAIEKSSSKETNKKGNIDVPDSDNFEKLSVDVLKKTEYNKLYNEQELEKVCETFNNDVREERKKNERDAWKVRMIQYQ